MNENKVKNQKTLVAMSGGVDSAVCALLEKNSGQECVGITMDLQDRDKKNSCCTSEDVIDAKKICDLLSMQHTVTNLSDFFRDKVISYFVDSYINGETPNPCVMCNKQLKFGKLLEIATELGCDTLATGHYARIKYDGNRHLLMRAACPEKDQTYVLWMLTENELSRVHFPLGEYSKDEVRSIAESHGFSNARKKDSQDICFIPDGDYASYIERFCGHSFPYGNFIDIDGNILGQHSGIIKYTTGQRKGLGIALGKPMYVLSKDAERNTVTLSSNEQLFSDSLTASRINLIAVDNIFTPKKYQVKVRYNHKPCDATVTQTDNDTLTVVFDTPQRAITKGQSLVIYDGDIVIGGGIIN